MKYRKKPIVIEAMQYTGDNFYDICAWADEHDDDTDLFTQLGGGGDVNRMYIETLERNTRTDIGDWIIRDIKGEYYPCKPDIFEATYEAVDNNPLKASES